MEEQYFFKLGKLLKEIPEKMKTNYNKIIPENFLDRKGINFQIPKP